MSPPIQKLEELYSPTIQELLDLPGNNGKSYAPLTKINMAKLLQLINDHLKIRPEINAILQELITLWSAQDSLMKTREDITVENVLTALENSTLSKHSKESILVRLMLEVPARDNLQLGLRYDTPADPTSFKAWLKNYVNHTIKCKSTRNSLIKAPGNRYIVFIVNTKNISSYQPRLYPLSHDLSVCISKYLDEMYPIGIPKRGFNYPFGVGKHSKFIGWVLEHIGIKKGKASINLLRQAVANTARATGDPAKIAKTALDSFHTIQTSVLSYEHN